MSTLALTPEPFPPIKSEMPGWVRVLLILGVIAAGPLLVTALHLEEVPATLLIPVLAVVGLFGFQALPRILNNPVLPCCGGLLMFALLGCDTMTTTLAGFSLKTNMLGLGVLLMFSVGYLVRDFGYFWKTPAFRLITTFTAIALIYYAIGYASDFQLKAVSAGYQMGKMGSETGETSAKFIVLLVSLGMQTAMTCALAVFNPRFYGLKPNLKPPDGDREAFQRLFQQRMKWMPKTMPFLLIAFSLFGFSEGGKSELALYYPMMFIQGYCLWRFAETFYPGARVLGVSLNTVSILALVLTALIIPLSANKTALIAVGVSLLVFYWGSRKLNCPWPWEAIGRFMQNGLFPKLLVLGSVVFVGAFIAFVGLGEEVAAKLDYFIKGFTKMGESSEAVDFSSSAIRKENLRLLFAEWNDNLNWVNVVFGFGLAKSRETIFYLSAMRVTGYAQLVQTLHNSYLEFLFDYGLVSLFYFGSIIQLFFSHRRHEHNPNADAMSRLFSLTLIATVLYIAIYGTMDGIRVPMAIQFFALLGFAEGYRQSALTHSRQSGLMHRTLTGA